MQRYPSENAGPQRPQDDTAESWQSATPDSLSSSLAEEAPALQPPASALPELSGLTPERLAVTGPSTTASGPSQHEPNFELVPNSFQRDPYLQRAPAPANQAHEASSQREVFHTANTSFQPAHVNAVPLRLVQVKLADSTPQRSTSKSMLSFSDSGAGDLCTCSIVGALLLLAGLLLFYYVFRMSLSASDQSGTTTETVAGVEVVLRRAEPPRVGRLPRHGREEQRDSNQSDPVTVSAAVTTEDVLDNEAAGERTTAATSKETVPPWYIPSTME
ncbi:uncharacterized protein [Dermacentor albipictus]|uniref:uncharacterized protein isoform X2 n=1 Tax=Dermacentor albipictus TaxID=60249 RepID=UPI0038FC1DC7